MSLQTMFDLINIKTKKQDLIDKKYLIQKTNSKQGKNNQSLSEKIMDFINEKRKDDERHRIEYDDDNNVPDYAMVEKEGLINILKLIV